MSLQNPHNAESQLGAYALGALDLEDLPSVEAALAVSPEQREELRRLREVVALLPYTAPPVEPPARVRKALMARIAAGTAAQPAAAPAPPPPAPRRRSWVPQALAAALATVVLALAGLTFSLSGNVARMGETNRELVTTLGDLQAALADTQQRQEALATQLTAGQRQLEQVSAELAASEERISQVSAELAASEQRVGQLAAQRAQDEYVISFVSAPGVATRDLNPAETGTAARGEMYMYPGNPNAVVLFSGLPALAPGQVYQFWLADGSTQVAGDTFVVDGGGIGHIIVQAPREVNAFSQVMVTVEPEGGSTTPSEQVVLEGNL